MLTQFFIPEKSTIVTKPPTDWAFDLPEKFLSRLVLYFRNKDLGNFAAACKSWYTAAFPLMKMKAEEFNESKTKEFRIARKIYDAKRKVKAFVGRNPRTMNPAQQADLIRSQTLLQNANEYDLGMEHFQNFFFFR